LRNGHRNAAAVSLKRVHPTLLAQGNDTISVVVSVRAIGRSPDAGLPVAEELVVGRFDVAGG
jgi:hypothetical protein